MNNKLKDYTLWWDGIIEVHPKDLSRMTMLGIPPNKISITEITPEIIERNKYDIIQLSKRADFDKSSLNHDWIIPEKYSNLDILEYFDKNILSKVDPKETEKIDRLVKELEFWLNGHIDLLKCIIYIVDTFKENNIVWGVGRGSSCASYLLFLIGLHSVDPIKYNIPIEEFFR